MQVYKHVSSFPGNIKYKRFLQEAEIWHSKGCFHSTAKCVFWIMIRNAHLESRFEIRYFGPCVRQKTSRIVIWGAHLKSRFRCVLELRISNHDSQCFLAYTRSKYRILNRDSRCASRITIQITIQNTHFAVVWKPLNLIQEIQVHHQSDTSD